MKKMNERRGERRRESDRRRDLVEVLATQYATHRKAVEKSTVILATSISIFVASAIGIGVSIYVSKEAENDAYARSQITCKVSRDTRIELNKRAIYAEAVRVIVDRFSSVRKFLEKYHEDLYPMPQVSQLPLPNCEHLPR